MARVRNPLWRVCALALVAHACGDEPSGATPGDAAVERVQPLPCLTSLDLSCQPGYEPTFANVYERTLRERCADCHAAATSTFRVERDLTAAVASAPRLEQGANPLVIPGDPACSPLMIRLESLDPTIAMPPRVGRVAADERCAIAHWIAQGAPR